MNAYFFNISNQEKENILTQHKEVYNGYKTLNPAAMSNEQPLYVQDFANDKEGITVNNKGEVKQYTNMHINESVLDETNEETCEQCQMEEDGQDGGQMDISMMGDSIMGSQDFQSVFQSLDPAVYDDEFEYADNVIYNLLNKYEDELYFEDLVDYIKDVYSEDLFDAYRVTVGDDFFGDNDIQDIDYEEIDEIEADDMDVSAVEPGYQFVSHGPEDVYGTMKDYDSEHPHHDYNSMEDVEKYDPSTDLANMFPDLSDAMAFSDEPSDTFQHDAGDIDREGDEGLGMDTENDMDLGKVNKGFNFMSGGSDDPYNEGEDIEEEVDDDLKESFRKTRNLTLEMFQRLSKFN